jgi:DNA invertase Pin-like site-specific DNA recombinase
MLIGYARVSTDDQTLDLQRDALRTAGCERIYEDKAGGAKADRPGLKEALGQLIFHIFGALAQFERTLIRERTQAGLNAARARGRKGGRRKLLDAKRRAHAVDLYKSKKHTAKEICALMGISRATLYSYIEEFSDGP